MSNSLLVFDEAHTFSGAAGAETACLIRRLRSFCGRGPEDTVCVATSATIADPVRGVEAGRDFAARFFGVEAEQVAVVGEEYVEDIWAPRRTVSPPLAGDPSVQLQTVLDAVAGVEREPPSKEALRVLKTAFQTMTGQVLEVARWQESLYDRLASNEVVYQIADALKVPRPLSALVKELEGRIGRPIPEEEVVAWLALGAASRREGRPLLRPVVHGFVRGVGGAVVTFPEGQDGPKLWLSREEATQAGSAREAERLFALDVTTCTKWGQYYFVHFVGDFSFTGRVPGGGEALEGRRVWRPQEQKSGGSRVVLLDRPISEDEEDADGEEPRNTATVYLCRRCGALHPAEVDRCDGCGEPGRLVPLLAVAQREERPGMLTSCVSCRAVGHARLGDYREPARPVRAQNVSDVHVLAQSMLQHAERKRLLIFSDNRQDAAFQAGWMQDHARRFRLESLMYEQIQRGPISVGDLTGALDELLDKDDDLSQALLPEVWRAERKEKAGTRHATERRRFLRFQVLREVVTGPRQRLGLEPWGRLLVEYTGLSGALPFFQRWAARLDCAPGALHDGVASLLDGYRRGGLLFDREGQMFSRYWHESDYEIARGYFPLLPGGPKGLKLRRAGGDEPSRVMQILSATGATAARQAVKRWGVGDPELEPFFEELWALLTEQLGLLVPVTLTGRRGSALPGCLGVVQLDADRLLLTPHKGLFRCGTCRRTGLRPTPRMACPGRTCKGTLVRVEEDPDNYDLLVLDQRFSMIRAREHSAQVPAEDRELLERVFKGDGELVNTLVCTPTLELGVDIGSLDSVLMRNVPPRPANYWQRVGRAGRRHRMAVNLTYARPTSHDRAYFAEPLKLLHGAIQPPRFNLKNELMVRKHVHAAVLTALHRVAGPAAADSGAAALGAADREEIARALEHCFPPQIKAYLFDAAEHVRTVPFDVGPLAAVVSKHRERLLAEVGQVFSQQWPEADKAVVTPEALRGYVEEMAENLAGVLRRLEARLRWALDQMARLDEARRQKGTLDPDEDALRARCDRLIKRLKGKQPRARRDAEGYDDTYTYAVLAAEGFLPGYGLDTGAVVGFHQAARYGAGRDWELRRGLALALREYAPGNLIYANGHRFLPRFFHLEAVEPTSFHVDTEHGAVSEVGLGEADRVGLGAATLAAVPICDVDLPHQSHITDDEDYRFQLPVTIYGYEQARHGGGRAFRWGSHDVNSRSSVHLRLVNVGPSRMVREGRGLGYPVCLVCGQSRSPLASQADRDGFSQDHLQRCGRPVGAVGFFADVIADAVGLAGCADATEAYSLAEALRHGAAEVLEMERSDLQLLAVGRTGEPQHDVLIFDPMPGGSGLLEQMIARWDEVVAAALKVVEECPSACATACVDCLLEYRNSAYHASLDRHVAARILRERGGRLVPSHEIPPALPERPDRGRPANEPEAVLRYLLERAGFTNARAQHPIDLGRPLGITTPDFFFEDPSGRLEGICLYLDGMSEALHGNAATHRRDRAIREELRSRAYDVIEIPYGQLSDEGAMRGHFYRLGRALLGKERAQALRDDGSWFRAPAPVPETAPASPAEGWEGILELIDPEWQPLALGLQKVGLPPPDDAGWDVPRAGRVSGKRAVLVWTRVTPFVALVDWEPGADPAGRLIRVTPTSEPIGVAAAVRAVLGEDA